MKGVLNIFSNNNSSRDVGYDFIRFYALFLILLSHFQATCKENFLFFPSIIKELMNRGPILCGRVGVALFFMLSGSVLLLAKDYTLGKFYKKRLLRLSVPQWVSFILFAFVAYIINDKVLKINVFGLILSFLGLNYFLGFWDAMGITTVRFVGEWFTTVIIILYLLFPFLKKCFYSRRWLTTILIFIMFAINLKLKICSSRSGAFSISNGIMYFG